jgi:hypothetical protein
VGHLARLLEEAGIATVIIAAKAFRKRLEEMSPPRVLITNHPMGRPVGPPGDRDRQLRVVEAALDMFREAKAVGSFAELTDPYRPGQPAR